MIRARLDGAMCSSINLDIVSVYSFTMMLFDCEAGRSISVVCEV